MSIQVAPHLARKKLVKDLSGNIIDWFEEGNGGWIVRGREVVNQSKWEEFQQKEKDKILAASAVAMAKVDEDAPDRTLSPEQARVELEKKSQQAKKVEELDKKVNEMDSKLDKILNALNGK